MMMGCKALAVVGALAIAGVAGGAAAERPKVSGIYPHLATFNNENECGTGAVVPWADRLWVISYGPHLPMGSSDKLYEITPDLEQIVRPESVGGTPANRMIHRESKQLLIGPYLIDDQRNVRVIAPKLMPGRLTGNARHLTDPTNKVYYGTMEEGLYEVDVRTLEVTPRIKDGNKNEGAERAVTAAGMESKLPGYHGKGLYSGQGRVVYANNGEHGAQALMDPTTPSGALAEWRGEGDWKMVRRNQFTEVTGPGGLEGNSKPATDPIWTVGWDARSVIVMVLDGGEWRAYRLPKGSHSYDGAHGWNTEWPRIRDIGKPGKPDFLMTMHGVFWRFPHTFSAANSAGLQPRSAYLKVVGDFCRWRDEIVFGCDDTARSEFLNKRKAKGAIAGPGQSQSNLWFVDPDGLDELGPVLGRGAIWLNDVVAAGTKSDPFLFTGFQRRGLHLVHQSPAPVKFSLEVDRKGDGSWREIRRVTVPPGGYAFVEFTSGEKGQWIRASADRDCTGVSAVFHYRNKDQRGTKGARMFEGLATPSDRDLSGGYVYARGANLRTLRFTAARVGTELGCYDMGADLKLRATNDTAGYAWANKNLAVPTNVLSVDAASVVYTDHKGVRWRLPKGDPAFDHSGYLGDERIAREVCTERDLFNAHGTFYELPAENAGGFAKIRPIATHNRRIADFCSWRGLLVMTGVAADAGNPHMVRSEDGECAVWVGAVDDLWQFGKPRGTGGPWKNSFVTEGQPSDAYLMTGYDRKRLALSHTANEPLTIRAQVDISGTGTWATYREFTVNPGQPLQHEFPESFGAYWIRFVADRDTVATAQLIYE